MKCRKKQIGIGCLLTLLLLAAVWFLTRPSADPLPKAAQPPVFEKPRPPIIVSRSSEKALPARSHAGAVGILMAPEASFDERVAALKKLGQKLSAADIETLREFLNTPLSDFPDQYSLAINSVKNDVLGLLMEQEPMPEGLSQDLLAQFNNPETDPVWREYILQFGTSIVEQTLLSAQPSNGQTGVSAPQKEKELFREAMFAALDQRDGDLAGTALLGLNRLSKKDTSISREEIMRHAVEIAADSDASNLSRLTALRLAAGNECADVLPVARNLAQHAQTDLLRAAAITTLGDFGEEVDLPLLKTLSGSRNRQLAAAAKSSLKNF